MPRVTYAAGITDAAALLRIAAETALKRANLHMFAEIAALLDGLASDIEALKEAATVAKKETA